MTRVWLTLLVMCACNSAAYDGIVLEYHGASVDVANFNLPVNPFRKLKQIEPLNLNRLPIVRANAQFCQGNTDFLFPILPNQIECDAHLVEVTSIQLKYLANKPKEQVTKMVLRHGFKYDENILYDTFPNLVEVQYANDETVIFNMLLHGRMDAAMFEFFNLMRLAQANQLDLSKWYIGDYARAPVYIAVQPKAKDLQQQLEVLYPAKD